MQPTKIKMSYLRIELSYQVTHFEVRHLIYFCLDSPTVMDNTHQLPEVIEGPKLDISNKGPAPQWAQESLRDVPHLHPQQIKEIANCAEENGRGHKGQRDKILILTLFDSCLRVSEALGLRPVDIVQNNSGFRLKIMGKGRKPAEAAISSSVVAQLQSYILDREIPKNELIFPISRKRVHQMIKAAFESAQIPKPPGTGFCHVLRHSGAIARLRATRDPRSVQEQLRHVSPAMTLRYLKTLTREEALEVQSSVDLLRD